MEEEESTLGKKTVLPVSNTAWLPPKKLSRLVTGLEIVLSADDVDSIRLCLNLFCKMCCCVFTKAESVFEFEESSFSIWLAKLFLFLARPL